MLISDDDPRWGPYKEALGSLCMIWADLDSNIHEAIWELANLDVNVGACITSQIFPTFPRFRALGALVHLRGGNPSLMKAVSNLSATVEALARQRNRFVHDPWSINDDGSAERIEMSVDKKLTFDFVPTQLTAITDLEAKIMAATNEFHTLHRRILDELPPWPRTQYEQSLGIHTVWSEPKNGR
jgi:hypothetical protein